MLAFLCAGEADREGAEDPQGQEGEGEGDAVYEVVRSKDDLEREGVPHTEGGG